LNNAERLADDDGYTAGLDGLPRKCPPKFLHLKDQWMAGYDDGAKMNIRASKALASVGIKA